MPRSTLEPSPVLPRGRRLGARTAGTLHAIARHLAFFTLLFAVAPGQADEGQERQFRTWAFSYPDNAQVVLGQGFDRVEEIPTSTICVTFASQREQGQESFFQFRETTDRSEVMEALEVSAHGRVRGIFGTVEGRARFATSVKVSQQFHSIAAEARTHNGAESAVPSRPGGSGAIRLLPRYAELAARDREEFYRLCGNGFVSELHTGAHVSVVVTVRTTSLEEQQEISAAAQASGAGWEAGGEFDRIMQRYQARKQLEILYYQSGGSGRPLAIGRAQLLTRLADVPRLAAEAPRNERVTVAGYESLPNWPQGPVLEGPGRFREIARYWGLYETLAETTDYLLEPRNESSVLFGRGVTRRDVENLRRDLIIKLRRIRKLAEDCTDAATRNLRALFQDDCELRDELKVDGYELRADLPLLYQDPWRSEWGLSDRDLLARLTDQNIRAVSARRCRISFGYDGCLTDDEIREYAREIRVEPFTLEGVRFITSGGRCLEQSTQNVWARRCSNSKRQSWTLEQNGPLRNAHDGRCVQLSRDLTPNWILGATCPGVRAEWSPGEALRIEAGPPVGSGAKLCAVGGSGDGRLTAGHRDCLSWALGKF